MFNRIYEAAISSILRVAITLDSGLLRNPKTTSFKY
jgi:inorganic pyrophosphatase/exopolyphosphatase